MKNMLVDLKVDVDKLRVESPRAGLLGQGASGESLKTRLDLASDRFSSTLSHLSDALIRNFRANVGRQTRCSRRRLSRKRRAAS